MTFVFCKSVLPNCIKSNQYNAYWIIFVHIIACLACMIAFVKTLFWNALCWEEMLSLNEPKVKMWNCCLKKKKEERCWNVLCTEMLTVMMCLQTCEDYFNEVLTHLKYGFLPTNSLNSTAKLNCLIYGKWYICSIFNDLLWWNWNR